MKRIKDKVLEHMQHVSSTSKDIQFTTQELSDALNMQRTNLSKILNELVKEGKVRKLNGRPVYYSLVKEQETTCFKKMVGCESSLKQVVQLTKAALLYPGHCLPVLIMGADGTGKSMLAKLIYEFAKEQKIIDEDSPFIRVNCRYLINETKEKIQDVFFSETEGVVRKAKDGVLFIDHINRLVPDVQNRLLRYVEMAHDRASHTILVYSIDDTVSAANENLYTSKFSILVELPLLSARTFEERQELINGFFQKEALSIHKTIQISSEILRCLILYPCALNVKQLRSDIRLACANGCIRHLDRKSEKIELQLNDFPNHVRKGILSYPAYRNQIEKIIAENCLYCFSGQGIAMYQEKRLATENTVYPQYVDDKVKQLKEHGVEEEKIMKMIQTDLDEHIRDISEKVDRKTIVRMVDAQIIHCVEEFLTEASACLQRIYPTSLFYALCLHMQALTSRKNESQKLSNEQIVKIIQEHEKEYELCSRFALKLESTYKIKLSVDEIAFLSLFIAKEMVENTGQAKPVVLVAMHGNSTATSIVQVVEAFVGKGNIFAFDLVLDQDMQKVYEHLYQTIVKIHQGQGVLMMYDMGSLKTMAQMISSETGILIKTFCVPATLLALECSRKASCQSSLDEIYESVMNSYRQIYPEIARCDQKQDKPQVILSLCMSKEGTAIQIKNYIEQHMHLENTEIVPLAVSDREYLLKEVNDIRKKQKIMCVIGAYDPKLYGIPYIPISNLLDTPADKLDILLSLNTLESVSSINYNMVYGYLEEQLEGFDFQLLKEILPRTITRIKKVVHGLSSDQEIGLFMHIACLIHRLQNDKTTVKNRNTQQILLRNKRLYNDLREILRMAEEEFYVRFNEDEMANIIQIIKQC